MLARWDLVNSSDTARDKLKKLRQQTSVQVYTRRFLGCGDEIDDLSESEMRDRYLVGLKPEVHKAVALHGFSDLATIIAAGERIDAIDFRLRTRDSPRTGDLCRGRPEFNELDHRKSYDRSKIKCYGCGQLGHIRRDCNVPRRHRNPGPTKLGNDKHQ